MENGIPFITMMMYQIMFIGQTCLVSILILSLPANDANDADDEYVLCETPV